MGRAPCCDKANVKRGTWSPDEDAKLIDYLKNHGTGGNWISLPQKAGLKRCGKSCRLRWLNYLRPHIKHGGFTEEEDKLIYSFYSTIGSRWSLIAAQLPGRTDNDVKNHWNTKLKKRFLGGSNTNSSVCPQFSSSTTQPKVETFVFDHNNSADTHVLDLKPTPISPLESDVSVSLPSIPLANETSSVFSNAISLAKEENNEWLGGYYGHEGEGDVSILGDSVYEDLLLNGFAFQAKSSQGSL